MADPTQFVPTKMSMKRFVKYAVYLIVLYLLVQHFKRKAA